MLDSTACSPPPAKPSSNTPKQDLAAGREARRNGDDQAALLFLRAALQEDPRHEPATLECADLLRHLGEIAAADALLTSLVAHAPACTPAHMALARAARARGDAAATLDHLWYATAGDARMKFWAWQELAQEQRRAGRFAEATASYHRAAEIDPARALPWTGLAECARRSGDRSASLAALQTALRLTPNDAEVQARMGDDLVELGRYAEAEAAYAAVRAVQPQHLLALCGAAILARRCGAPDQAMQLLDHAAAAHPGAILPLLHLAQIRRELGEHDAARKLLSGVLARDPASVTGWMQTGLLERACGNAPAALAAFEEAYRLQPRNLDAILQVAEENRTLGHQARCDTLFALAASLDANHAGTMRRYARQAAMSDDHAASLAFCERGLLMAPDSVQLICAAADALAKLGRADDALALLDAKTAALGPLPTLVAKRLALLRDAGDLPHAMDIIQTVLDADAGPPALAGQDTGQLTLLAGALRVLLRVGSAAQIERCLALAAPVTAQDRAILATMQAMLAEDRDDPAAARTHYLESTRWYAADPGTWMSLARTAMLMFDLDGAYEYLRRNRDIATPALRLLQRSANVSQTLFGQILDEYRLDDALVQSLRGVLERAPPDRLDELLHLVRAHPDSTLIATAMIDTLARTGRLADQAGAPDRAANIPPVIVQFWDNPTPPPDISALMDGWARHNPGYRHQVFDERRAKLFLWQHHGIEAVHAFDAASQPAQKADLFRLAYLVALGGVYADADDRCYASIDALVTPAHDLVLYREDLGTLGNNFIAAAPNHPVLREALRLAIQAVLRGDNDILWFSTGPGLMARAFASMFAADTGFLHLTRVLSLRELHQSVAIHCRTVYKTTDLAWHNSSFARIGSGLAA